jgi:hypothetical protein
LKQFHGKEADIEAARLELNGLEPAMRDVHIGIVLNLKAPDLQSRHSEAERFADSSDGEEFGDESEGQGDDSDVAGPAAKRARRPRLESGSTQFGDDSEEPECKPEHRRAYKTRARTGTIGRTNVFQGKLVCQWALQKLYGIGDALAQTLRHGGRSQRPGDRVQPKHPELGRSMLVKSYHRWPSVLMFFWILYHSVAEGLPEGIVKMERLHDSVELEAGSQKEGLDTYFAISGDPRKPLGKPSRPNPAAGIRPPRIDTKCVLSHAGVVV